MKAITALAIVGMGIGSAVAGPMGTPAPTKGGKVVEIEPLPATGCACFDASCQVEFGAFYTHTWADGGHLDNQDGGGISFGYFYNEYIGTRLAGSWIGSQPIHDVTLSVVARYPVTSLCVAPYAFGGLGGKFNSTNEFTGHAGGGLEWRLEALSCTGIFCEGKYTWDDADGFTSLNAGVRFNF